MRCDRTGKPYRDLIFPPTYTPLLPKLLGENFLDVCSTPYINETYIQATRFYDQGIDGLAQDWRGAVWCFPPSGSMRFFQGVGEEEGKWIPFSTQGKRSVHAAVGWWKKLMSEYRRGHTTEALFLCCGLNPLAYTANDRNEAMLNYPFIIPYRAKMKYVIDDNKGFKHPNLSSFSVLIYLPPPEGFREKIQNFALLFQELGQLHLIE
jgi:hypothetical protein